MHETDDRIDAFRRRVHAGDRQRAGGLPGGESGLTAHHLVPGQLCPASAARIHG